MERTFLALVAILVILVILGQGLPASAQSTPDSSSVVPALPRAPVAAAPT